jgi:hypothetical protein
MLPQPPPDAPAPPPSEAEMVSRRKWKWLWEMGLVSILLLVMVGLVRVPKTRCKKNSDQIEAVNNARQIGLALFEFEAEFGKSPDSSTIPAVRAKTSTDLDLGSTTSNEFFRQLIATGITSSEHMFYSKIDGARKPDKVMIKGEALKKGECGFTYFIGAKATDNPGRPLVVTPMIPGTDRFDPNAFKGKAVVLRRDNSVTSLTINKSGHVLIDGRNMMDPHHPIWDGHAPVIAWPE